MKKILIASNNDLKIEWFREALKDTGLEILTLKDIQYETKTEECGDSFEVNAVIKALEPALLFPQLIVVADDGGVFFEYDENIGGLCTNRYSGDLCKDILTRLEDAEDGLCLENSVDIFNIPSMDRNCYFEGACAVAWWENSKVCFKTILTRSSTSLEVASLASDEIENGAHVHEIINRVYPDGTIRLSDMSVLLKMESVGVLDPYLRLGHFIKTHISCKEK